MYHMVYTPIKGSTAGGHFYSYETMHLTELASHFDGGKDADGVPRASFATNTDHPDLQRFAARMILALPCMVKERRKCTYLSLTAHIELT
jgi:hypothetical protein